jgi:DNA-binding Lrp family transcriptional regulator
MLGFDVTVFAFVSLVSQAEADLVGFEQQVQGWPLVRECHMLQGDTDFLLKVVARDLDSYNRFLTSQLTAADNVANVRSAITIRTTKRQYGVPVNPDAEPEDFA